MYGAMMTQLLRWIWAILKLTVFHQKMLQSVLSAEQHWYTSLFSVERFVKNFELASKEFQSVVYSILPKNLMKTSINFEILFESSKFSLEYVTYSGLNFKLHIICSIWINYIQFVGSFTFSIVTLNVHLSYVRLSYFLSFLDA